MRKEELEKRYYELLPVREENEEEFKEVCDKLMNILMNELIDM